MNAISAISAQRRASTDFNKAMSVARFATMITHQSDDLGEVGRANKPSWAGWHITKPNNRPDGRGKTFPYGKLTYAVETADRAESAENIKAGAPAIRPGKVFFAFACEKLQQEYEAAAAKGEDFKPAIANYEIAPWEGDNGRTNYTLFVKGTFERNTKGIKTE